MQNNHIEHAPVRFTPYLKSVIWGGTKICNYKNIACQAENIGESWEVSAVPGHESVVESGTYAGMSITQLIDMFGAELLGRGVCEKYGNKFPLLIKLIDAADNLSVQVHPDDRLAMTRHNSLGKTEMWYIISTDKNACIYSGLKMEMTPDEYTRRVADGTFAETLAVHDSRAGDVFFLPAGRVHAIGAGNLLAEIQESSDITYRIYDYDRRDSSGNLRELHTQLAKDAIDFNVYDDYKSPAASDLEKCARIVACSHFVVNRVLVDGETELSFDKNSFTVLMCVDGKVTVEYPVGRTEIEKGHTVLCPAVLDSITVSGKGTLIVVQD